MNEVHSQRALTGGCLCGAVRYAAAGEPLNVRICHCRLCQKATGQAFFARAMFASDAVSIAGETAGFHSSEDLERRFCPRCGTGLFAQRRSRQEVISITLGSFDDPGGLKPEVQIWTSRRIGWVETLDDIPGHGEGPPG